MRNQVRGPRKWRHERVTFWLELGLLLFTQNDESLYLIDEPDTHLNPVWTYDFLRLLQDNIRAEKGQLIVATHNPLMIGSLHKNQVRVLAQTDDGIVANEPDYDPIGIGVEGLLKSELYGLRSTLAPDVLQKLDRHYALLGTRRPRTDSSGAGVAAHGHAVTGNAGPGRATRRSPPRRGQWSGRLAQSRGVAARWESCGRHRTWPAGFGQGVSAGKLESNTYLTVSRPGSQTCRESQLMGVTNRCRVVELDCCP